MYARYILGACIGPWARYRSPQPHNWALFFIMIFN